MEVASQVLSEKNREEGERLTQIIKKLGLSCNQFSQTIRVSKSLIVQFCNGKRALQNYHFLLITLIHNVSEKFLKEGEEPMFAKKRRGSLSAKEEVIANTRASYGLDPSKKNNYFNELILSKNKIMDKNEKLLNEKDKVIKMLEAEIKRINSEA